MVILKVGGGAQPFVSSVFALRILSTLHLIRWQIPVCLRCAGGPCSLVTALLKYVEGILLLRLVQVLLRTWWLHFLIVGPVLIHHWVTVALELCFRPLLMQVIFWICSLLDTMGGKHAHVFKAFYAHSSSKGRRIWSFSFLLSLRSMRLLALLLQILARILSPVHCTWVLEGRKINRLAYYFFIFTFLAWSRWTKAPLPHHLPSFWFFWNYKVSLNWLASKLW